MRVGARFPKTVSKKYLDEKRMKLANVYTILTEYIVVVVVDDDVVFG